MVPMAEAQPAGSAGAVLRGCRSPNRPDRASSHTIRFGADDTASGVYATGDPEKDRKSKIVHKRLFLIL